MFEDNHYNNLVFLRIITINEKNYNDFHFPNHLNFLITTFAGSLKINIENSEKVYTPEHLLIIPEQVCFRISKCSAHKIYVIAFSNLIFDDDSYQLLIKTYKILTNQNFIVCEILYTEIKFIKQFFNLFKSSEYTNNKQLQKEIFLVGLNFLKQKIVSKLNSSKPYNIQKFNIFFQFIQLLELNYKQEHSSVFYAENLNITTNYLNKIIKYFTNITSKKYIENFIITESKILLLNSNLTVSEISDSLGFQNVSNFCMFFKNHTQTTPTNYRNKYNKRK